MTAADSLEIVILGSGTCVPSLTRSAPGVLVTTAGRCALLDIGPGTLHRLLASGHTMAQVDRIFLSHFHPDHTSELAAFLFASNYPADRRRRDPLHLAGGPGLSDFYGRLTDLYGHWVQLEDHRLVVTEWPARTGAARPWGNLEVRTAPMAHNPESLAIRLSTPAGRSVVYSGDTAPCDALVAVAAAADVLICEAAVPAGRRGIGHMTPAEAGEMAARAGVGHLILTHFYPDCERVDIAADARRTWHGPLTLATDLLRIPVPADPVSRAGKETP